MLRRELLSRAPLLLGFAATAHPLHAASGATKSILDFGASPGGAVLCTQAIQRAVDAVAQAGGGVVLIPSGTFLTGKIELRSRVTLSLQSGARLLGSTSIDDYRGGDASGPAHGPHLIVAQNADDVAVTGPGLIDGQGPAYWEPSGRAPLAPDEQWADVASHDLAPKKSGRPSPMLEFVNCRRLRIDGVHLENAPGWTLRAVTCDQVEIRNVAIRNPRNGPNTDGIDIACSQNVLISGCTVDTGDDAVCLKSENPYGSDLPTLKNITVTGCTLTTCCNGFKLGTGSEGGFENITFTNSTVVNQDLPFRDRVISGIALEVVDGGWIDGVVATGIRMQRTRTPIFIRLGNRKPPRDPARHGLRNVRIDDVQATEAILASSITGLPGMEVQNIALSHLTVESVLPGRPEWTGLVVPEKDRAYPEARMFGMLPASGLYVRHARGLTLDDVSFTAPPGEPRSTVILDDVTGARIDGLRSSPVSGGNPALRQIACSDVKISGAQSPEIHP